MRFRVHQQNLGKTIQAYKMIIKQLTDPAAGTGLEQKLNSYVHENLGKHSSSQGKVNRIRCKMLASNRGNLLVQKSKLDYLTYLFFFCAMTFSSNPLLKTCSNNSFAKVDNTGEYF